MKQWFKNEISKKDEKENNSNSNKSKRGWGLRIAEAPINLSRNMTYNSLYTGKINILNS